MQKMKLYIGQIFFNFFLSTKLTFRLRCKYIQIIFCFLIYKIKYLFNGYLKNQNCYFIGMIYILSTFSNNNLKFPMTLWLKKIKTFLSKTDFS